MRIFGSTRFGPREEKAVMTGAGLTSKVVLAMPIVALGCMVELIYFRMAMASSDDTADPGRT